MKSFELSSKENKNGRRKFKAVLHEIFPDSCIDEENKVGTKFNENGITWIRKYCEATLPSIKGMSLRCEFLDDERTELCGHGDTDIKDGLPIFENADVIGHFTNGYIEDITTDDGEIKTVCIGEGEIDSLCYNNFVKKLEEDIVNGNAPNGSIEILKTEGNTGIVYKYGYKAEGRIPTIFEYSGYALLGISPADHTAKILELNSKEDLNKMNETEIKALITQIVNEATERIVELDECKKKYEQNIAEANEAVATANAEKDEAIANSNKVQEALDQCRKELSETYEKLDGLHEEINALEDELGKAKAKERIGELNSAIAEFSDEEKSYAKAEIDNFNANPVEVEINSVVSKIWEGIGKKAKETEITIVSEQNAAKQDLEDIFSEVDPSVSNAEDTNIF